MTHPNTNIPTPPYTYNDYRITYNEKCFFYNGGYDLTCLVTKRTHRGSSGLAVGRYSEKSYPSSDMIDLVFKVCVQYVNDKKYEDEEYCEIKKYSFKKNVDVSIKTEDVRIKRKILQITADDFNVKTVENFSSTTSVAQRELKTYVSSSLYFKNPRKIKIKSTLTKNKNNNSKE